jgi:hypothetical protein
LTSSIQRAIALAVGHTDERASHPRLVCVYHSIEAVRVVPSDGKIGFRRNVSKSQGCCRAQKPHPWSFSLIAWDGTLPLKS